MLYNDDEIDQALEVCACPVTLQTFLEACKDAKSSEREESAVQHPNHYGGGDNPYEAIKVIEAWKLGFNLGNTTKYISRAGKKGDRVEDLEKALFYLQREISKWKACSHGSGE